MSLPTAAALRIALTYLIVATCWILFTDQMLDPLFARAPLGIPSPWWQSMKGLFFVGITSAMLYVVLSNHFALTAKVADRYRESEHRWQRLLNQTPEPVLILDDAEVVYANRAAVDVLGADTREEIVGRTVHFLFRDVDDGVHVLTAEEDELRECFITDLNGRSRCIETRSSIISFNGRQCLLSVWRDVTSRHHYEVQLVAAKNEAENASRMKSTILANLSHEIRTPLTAILGFSDLLDRDPDAPQQESLELIHRSGLRLKETLESILTLAELESGDTVYQPEPIDIRDVVRTTAEIFFGQAARKGLTLDISIPTEPVKAVADRKAVSQIVMNLVSNAVKFTDSGSVAVGVNASSDGALIEVRDTGIGIDDDFLPHIFDEFAQASEGLDRAYEGSGLGLTIVRQLVELQAGTIDVESPDGGGTRFSIELPAASGRSIRQRS